MWQAGDSLQAVPTADVIFNPSGGQAVVSANFFAMGVVGLVLLIACANLASFLLARAVDRRKEVALRLALGAGRGRLIRQFLTETLVLALLGGVVGFLLAGGSWTWGWGSRSPPFTLGLDLSLDWTVLAFTLLVSLATGVLVGLVPALQATRPEVAPTLKDEGSGSDSPRVLTLSRFLVTGQMAVSVVLLVAAGLFIRSFDASRLMDPGFGQEPTALLSCHDSFPGILHGGRVAPHSDSSGTRWGPSPRSSGGSDFQHPPEHCQHHVPGCERGGSVSA